MSKRPNREACIVNKQCSNSCGQLSSTALKSFNNHIEAILRPFIEFKSHLQLLMFIQAKPKNEQILTDFKVNHSKFITHQYRLISNISNYLSAFVRCEKYIKI